MIYKIRESLNKDFHFPWTLWLNSKEDVQITQEFDYMHPPEPFPDNPHLLDAAEQIGRSRFFLVVTRDDGGENELGPILMDKDGFSGFAKRLRDRISEKLSQLPTRKSAVIVVDTSETFEGPESVYLAAYGDLEVISHRQAGIGIIDSHLQHKGNGLFANSTRLSAIVYQKRSPAPDREICLFRYVFPTNNQKAVFHLDEQMLAKFGIPKDQTVNLNEL
jgi:hypothetical protein